MFYTKKSFYFFTAFLLILSLIFVIPDLTDNLKDLEKTEEVFKYSEMYYFPKPKSPNKIEGVLVLVMESGNHWEFSESYSKYWDDLKSKINIGKRYTFYYNKYRHYNWTNPRQVEINNKIIYGINSQDESYYYTLLVTLASILISAYLYIKRK